MRGQFDLLVPPFRCPVDAGDQRRTVHAAEIAEDKRITSLGLVGHTLSEAKMPGGVLLPGMPLQISVLVICAWLHFAPVAVKDILLGVDQVTAVFDCGVVQRVFRHVVPPFRCVLETRYESFLCKAKPVIHAHNEATRVLIRKSRQLIGTSRIFDAKTSCDGQPDTGQGTQPALNLLAGDLEISSPKLSSCQSVEDNAGFCDLGRLKIALGEPPEICRSRSVILVCVREKPLEHRVLQWSGLVGLALKIFDNLLKSI